MKFWMIFLMVAMLAMLAGCDGSNPNGPGPEPDPLDATEGVYAIRLSNIYDEKGGSIDGYYFLEDGEEFPIQDGQVIIDPLERDTDNIITLYNASGDTILMNVDGREAKSFTVRLDTGTPLRNLAVPQSIVALGKPVIPTTGSLVIFSTPAGATVYLDGVEVGITPYSRDDLDPKVYLAELDLYGFGREVKDLEVKVGETTEWDVELVALTNQFEGFVNGREWVYKRSNGANFKIVIDVHGETLTITVVENGYKAHGQILNPYTGAVEFQLGAAVSTGNFSPVTQEWSGIDSSEFTWTITLL